MAKVNPAVPDPYSLNEGAHCPHPRVTVLRWRRLINEIDSYSCENHHTEDGEGEQGSAYFSVFLQEPGAGGPKPPLRVDPIAIFEFHAAPVGDIF